MSSFFEKISKIVKSLARLSRKKDRGLKTIKLEMKKEVITVIIEIQSIMRDYYNYSS